MKCYVVTVFKTEKLKERHIYYDMQSAAELAAYITEYEEDLFCLLEVGNEEETNNGSIKISFRHG